MSLIENAINFAFQKHSGQKRKYSNDSYIVHPMRVFVRLKEMNCPIEMQIVGLLHDTLEDTETTYEELEKEFGKSVADGVLELTNPSKKHPELNRFYRKKMDRKHLETVTKSAKIIKFIDRLDNLREMFVNEHPSDFVWIYTDESYELAQVLKDASQELYLELKGVMQKIKEKYLIEI